MRVQASNGWGKLVIGRGGEEREKMCVQVQSAFTMQEKSRNKEGASSEGPLE